MNAANEALGGRAMKLDAPEGFVQEGRHLQVELLVAQGRDDEAAALRRLHETEDRLNETLTRGQSGYGR